LRGQDVVVPVIERKKRRIVIGDRQAANEEFLLFRVNAFMLICLIFAWGMVNLLHEGRIMG